MNVQLPENAGAPSGSAPLSPPLRDAAPSAPLPLRILLVSDDAAAIKSIKSALASPANEIILAPRGVAAVACAGAEEISVIVITTEEPAGGALELAARLREFAEAEPIPLVFVGVGAETFDFASRLRSFADADYLPAPWGPDLLRLRLNIWAKLSGPRRVVQTQPTEARERTEREVESRRRIAELTAANLELDSFANTLAHDLRAPVRIVQGFAKILQEESPLLGDEGRECCAQIIGAAKRMDALIRDLLAYCRLSRCEMNLEAVSLEAALFEALAQFGREIQERKAQIDTQTNLPRVIAHSSTLTLALANLISNALKFVNESAPPRVRVWAETKGDRVRVWVEDNGIGIPENLQARVFGVFERGHSHERYPGTGVGLAIVKKGISRMNGDVGLESTAGQGSRFWLELNRAPDQDEELASTR